MLAWCPGIMTRRYIAGERARFISPVALYLFTVFLMFATLNFTGALGSGTGKTFKNGLKTELADQQQQLARLEAKRKLTLAAGKDVADLTAGSPSGTKLRDTQRMLSGQPLAVTDAGDEVPDWIHRSSRMRSEEPGTSSQ